jgi:hypothetical protein
MPANGDAEQDQEKGPEKAGVVVSRSGQRNAPFREA